MSRVDSDSRPYCPASPPYKCPSSSSIAPSHLLITETNRNEIFFPLSRLSSFSSNWESLAQHPKFSKIQHSDLVRIRRKHADDVDLQAFEFLTTWYQKYERQFRTVAYLVEALKAVGLFLAAESLEDRVNELEKGKSLDDRNGERTSLVGSGRNGLDVPLRTNAKRCARCVSWSSEPQPKKSFELPTAPHIPPELGLFQSFGNLSVEDDSRSELPCYPLNSNPLGFALIINNQNYQQDPTVEGSKRFDNREGTKKDAERLRWLWDRCGFEVKEYPNLSSKDIVERLTDVSRNHLLDEHDAFVCCILSHGGPDVVYGTDGVAVELNEIFSLFRADICENLAGKPKLFFVQACRGDKQDYGVVADGSQLIDRPPRATCTVPTGADFCISYAAEPGHVALRDVVNGTPYVCALCEAMVKHGSGGNRDIQYVLTAMNSRICSYAAPPDGRKQTPQVVNTLRKLLYLTMK